MSETLTDTHTILFILTQFFVVTVRKI